jgi:hypothetical protein
MKVRSRSASNKEEIPVLTLIELRVAVLIRRRASAIGST